MKRLLAFGVVAVLLCLSSWAQFNFTDLAFLGQQATSSARWYPTNAAKDVWFWYELTPINTATNTEGNGVGLWTNLAPNHLTITLSSDTTRPIFHSSGGGYNGLEPRISFNTNTANQRLITGSFSLPTFTMLVVMQNADVGSNKNVMIFQDANSTPWLFMKTNAITFNAGSSISGPNTLDTNWMILVAEFNGTSSDVQTNGVTYKTGSIGTGTMTTLYLDNNSYAGGFWPFNGSISRIWGWTNVLSAGDMTSAINQCKTDFGFP